LSFVAAIIEDVVVVVVVVVVGPSTHSPYPIPSYPVPPPSPSVSSILLFHHLPDPALGVPAITLTNLASALFSFSRSFPSFLFLFPDLTSCFVSFPLLGFASIQFSCIQFFSSFWNVVLRASRGSPLQFSFLVRASP